MERRRRQRLKRRSRRSPLVLVWLTLGLMAVGIGAVANESDEAAAPIPDDAATATFGFTLHPAIFLAMQGTCLFIGPSVYWYVRSMLPQAPGHSPKIWTHYLLGALYLITITTLVLTLENRPAITDSITPMVAVSVAYTAMFGQIFHVLWYFHRCINRINWHQSEVTDERESQRLRWMKVNIWVMAGIIVLLIVPFLFITAKGEMPLLEYLDKAFLLAIALAINYAAIQSINKPEMVLTMPLPQTSPPIIPANNWQGLNDDLTRLMEEKKPFLDGSMKLSQLATQLGVSDAELSRFLNQRHGKNYKEFINTYRVNEAKILLSQAEEGFDSIYGIALDSGFNSKATFNRVFKQMTGLSPSEYKRQNATGPTNA